mmetsp:Transcript_9882/g.12319  ORF Transcript_9882/g.12319 Transcript_9882/m.12319 type:complete len:243 (+) Transcript_9882:60-788(+)
MASREASSLDYDDPNVAIDHFFSDEPRYSEEPKIKAHSKVDLNDEDPYSFDEYESDCLCEPKSWASGCCSVCFATKRRKYITIAAITFLLVLTLVASLLFPRSAEINFDSVRSQLTFVEDSGYSIMSGYELPMEVFNPNFVAVSVSALSLDTTQSGASEDQFSIKIIASDPLEVIFLEPRDTGTYKVNITGRFSLFNFAAGVQCQSKGTMKLDYKGSAIVDHPLVKGKLEFNQKGVESKCFE